MIKCMSCFAPLYFSLCTCQYRNWGDVQIPWDWRDTRVVLLYAALLSVILLLGHVVIRRKAEKTSKVGEKQFGGVRTLCCLLLSGLSLVRAWNWSKTGDQVESGVHAMVVIYVRFLSYILVPNTITVLPHRCTPHHLHLRPSPHASVM